MPPVTGPLLPRPAVPPPVWVGGQAEAVVRLAARSADGWNGWGSSPDDFRVKASLLAEDTARRLSRSSSRWRDWASALPVEGFRLLDLPVPGQVAPYYRDWVEHELDDDYWKAVRVRDHFGEMTVRGLHAGGWHDLFLKGSIENYRGLREKGATLEAREGQRLLLGPWCHGPTSPEGQIGDVGFGPDAVLDMDQAVLEFVGGHREWRFAPLFPAQGLLVRLGQQD